MCLRIFGYIFDSWYLTLYYLLDLGYYRRPSSSSRAWLFLLSNAWFLSFINSFILFISNFILARHLLIRISLSWGKSLPYFRAKLHNITKIKLRMFSHYLSSIMLHKIQIRCHWSFRLLYNLLCYFTSSPSWCFLLLNSIARLRCVDYFLCWSLHLQWCYFQMKFLSSW